MSSLLRRSTSLAGISTSSIRAYNSFSVRGLRASTIPRSLLAARRNQYRLYSAGPPKKTPEDKNGAGKSTPEKKNGAAKGTPKQEGGAKNAPSSGLQGVKRDSPPGKGAQPSPQLPDGWVVLNDKELASLRRILTSFWTMPEWLGGDSGKLEARVNKAMDLAKTGVPPGMRPILQREMEGKAAISDESEADDYLGQVLLLHKQPGESGDEKSASGGGDKSTPEQKASEQKASDHETSGQKASDQKDTSEPKSEGKGANNSSSGKPEAPGGDYIWYAAALVAYFLWSIGTDESSREITWQELRKNFLEKGLIQRMVVTEHRVKVELNREATEAMYPGSVSAKPGFYYYFTIGSVDAFERRLEEAQVELGIPPAERIPVSYVGPSNFMNLLLGFGPTILLIGLLYYLTKRGPGGGGGGVFGVGKSKAKRFNRETSVRTTFADVAGMDEAKQEIVEFVNFLQQPARFQRLGAKIPRGAILSGPPGTGKTLLAKATAGESNVPFFSVSGSEFVEMFVGVGASRVRDLFTEARKNTPCIIFIDEIDAIGKSREGSGRFGGNDEREATLNQILTEMDGFNTSEQVVVLAGTNRPEILDKALMRPGRFDRHIHIEKPTLAGRQQVFKVYLQKVVTNEDIEYLCGRLSALTPGFAGADIANCVNEAALVAARANAKTITMQHFEQAIERVIGGLERKSIVLSPVEKKTVSYHEAGHAICGWYFEWADPLLKVSIIPRGGGALGYAQYLPGDIYLMTKRQLLDRMAMTLGGRVSEELHFPTVTTGASDDFDKVTQMATAMVTQWGMSDKLGPLHFRQDNNSIQKPFAEATGQLIDAEVRLLVDQAYKQCKELLMAKKKQVALVAEELLKKEVLVRDDMVRLLGPRPFNDTQSFNKYFGGASSPPPPSDGPGQPSEPPQPAAFRELKDDAFR